jgi:hypothetical protein
VLKIKLLPWQRWVLIHALELLPDGTFRFRTVILLMARQNGKSTLLQVLTLWRMFVDNAPLVIGTAQDLDTAEEQWSFVVEMAEDNPQLAKEIEQVLKVNGKKQMKLVGGQRYKVRAATRRAGRGLSGDLILLDELREHQSWEAWSAVTKTTMARARAQIWCASNAGDDLSVVLAFLRLMAHIALGDPDGLAEGVGAELSDMTEGEQLEGDSVGIFEYSASPGCDKWDRTGWAAANPSLGYPGMLTEKALVSAVRTDPDAVFRTECLCQWVSKMVESVIAAALWAGCADPDSQIIGEPSFALDVAPGRGWSAIAVAGLRDDGLPHVEVTSSITPDGIQVDHRGGTEWVVNRAGELADRWPGFELAVAANSAAMSMVPALITAGIKVKVIPANDVPAACGLFYDKATTRGLRHLGQGELTAALINARRNVDDGEVAWRWGRRKSSSDISPLYAATLALWCAIGVIDPGMSAVNNVW